MCPLLGVQGGWGWPSLCDGELSHIACLSVLFLVGMPVDLMVEDQRWPHLWFSISV